MAERDTTMSEFHHRMNAAGRLAVRRIDCFENPRQRFEDTDEVLFDALNGVCNRGTGRLVFVKRHAAALTDLSPPI